MFKVIKEQCLISDLIELYKSNLINLDPVYQRTGGIWGKKKNQLLIDSILNGIDLPKFYLHLFPEDNDKKYKYAVIDGKQRMLAIIGFYNNEFPLAQDFLLWDNPYNGNLANLYFDDITLKFPRLAGGFLNYTLDLTIIDSDEMERIDSMFIRINEGVSVNPAEKRNALGGRLIRLIAKKSETNPFFTNTLTFKDERKSYQELYLKLFALEKAGEIVSLNDGYLNNVLKEGKDCNKQDELLINDIDYRLCKIGQAFGNSEELFKKNNVILYYWFMRNKDLDKAAAFIREFEIERHISDDFDYQRFNELTRQGIYQKNKMKERLDILDKRFDSWA